MPQFVLTLADRSQLGDFSRLPMPDAYYSRVQRQLGTYLSMPEDTTYGELDEALRRRIAAITPVDNASFLAALPYLESLVVALRSRGSRVVFVDLPTSGLVRDIEQHRYPRALYWDKFAASTSAQVLRSEDDPEMNQFVCPDGSHLDARQRAAFTHAMLQATGLAPRPN